jgi:hypothetical protein
MSIEKLVKEQVARTHAPDGEVALRVWREQQRFARLQEVEARKKHNEIVKRMWELTPR